MILILLPFFFLQFLQLLITIKKNQAEPALMFDGVNVFANALQDLDKSHKLKLANLSCEKEHPWNDGLTLLNYLDSVCVCVYLCVPSQTLSILFVFYCNDSHEYTIL